ncbi:cysteine hydrolase family protein [Pseudomonas sp. UBA6562]|uniref:cysteine hydrolase family protein n=1 Tax=Pseudomonas sp. UBA6562 TaxID=1947332 RepID=UPI0025D9C3FA|nr:isochorismatase family protein [Pseudomonas sp. UBA6562]
MTRALIVIDIQNDYFPGGVLPLHDAQATVARVRQAIVHARAVGDRIVLVQHLSPGSTGLLATGSQGARIEPSILDAAGEAPVVVKQVADAFQETDLASHLDGVETLLIGGMMTQNCVVFTAMSGTARAFDVIVVEDLCAAPTEAVHQVALSALRSKLKVQSTAQVWPSV